jgi:hypothetical protein
VDVPQNFFTVAKALISQAKADANANVDAGRDNKHGYEIPEQELTNACVLIDRAQRRFLTLRLPVGA